MLGQVYTHDSVPRSFFVSSKLTVCMVCGTIGRPCPKLEEHFRETQVGPFTLPPPCIYLFPSTIPSPRNNPNPPAQSINEVEILKAFQECFKSREKELFSVIFNVAYHGSDTVRTTKIIQDGKTQVESKPTAIRRA